MLICVVALVALLASLVACTPDSTQRRPPAAAPSMAAAPGDVPAARWHAVLIAGDNNSPSFDNGIDALRDKLSARGVRDIRTADLRPGAQPVGGGRQRGERLERLAQRRWRRGVPRLRHQPWQRDRRSC